MIIADLGSSCSLAAESQYSKIGQGSRNLDLSFWNQYSYTEPTEEHF